MREIRNVGIMGNVFRVMAGLDSVYGYDIAVNDIFNSLIKYCSFEKLTCFYEPMQFQEIMMRRKYNSLKRKEIASVELEFVSEYDLIGEESLPKLDVLHNMSMEYMPQIYYRDVIAKDSFPVTYTIHGASYPYYIDRFYLLKLLFPFKPYDSLICTSTAVKDAVKNILDSLEENLNKQGNGKFKYKGRLDVVPLGVDVDFFKPQDKFMARKKYNIPTDAFVLLWIGRFSAYDKADLFPVITAFKRLLQLNQTTKLLFVIAGYDRKNMPILPKMIEYAKRIGIYDNMIFIDGHEMSKRQYLYSAADVFVSPIDNIQETFGLTPIEAMACGVPQVVSDWDGYKDTVIDGVTGFRIPTYWEKCDADISKAGLFPSEPMHRSAVHHLLMAQSVAIDLNIWVQKIQTLIDSPELCQKMSQKSVEVANHKFSWKRVIASYEELWSELIYDCDNQYKHIPCENIDFIRPKYCEYFKTYPTRFIDIEDRFQITSEGEDVLSGKQDFPEHYTIDDSLSIRQFAVEILELIKNRGSLSVGEILSYYTNTNQNKVKRGYMWLLKQGFLMIK